MCIRDSSNTKPIFFSRHDFLMTFTSAPESINNSKFTPFTLHFTIGFLSKVISDVIEAKGIKFEKFLACLIYIPPQSSIHSPTRYFGLHYW